MESFANVIHRLDLALDILVSRRVSSKRCTRMSSERAERIALLQGTLDLIVLRTLQTMGPQHSYAITTRLQQISEDLLCLNQGTLYPALIRLEQQGKIKGVWGKTEGNRDAKFYSLTKAGEKTLKQEALRWRRMAGLVERLLSEGA